MDGLKVQRGGAGGGFKEGAICTFQQFTWDYSTGVTFELENDPDAVIIVYHNTVGMTTDPVVDSLDNADNMAYFFTWMQETALSAIAVIVAGFKPSDIAVGSSIETGWDYLPSIEKTAENTYSIASYSVGNASGLYTIFGFKFG